MAQISDPKAMRALAHPLRIQLLEAVVARGTATATELAEALGESAANCSFHLRKLAEFGYLERADDATGREKPWRATDPTQDFVTDPSDPESLASNTAVMSAVREWDMARLQAAEGRQNPPAWRGATFQFGATMIITPDEAKELGRALQDLLSGYAARLTDRSLRPAGAGAVRLFAATTYLPEYQALFDAQAAEPPGSGEVQMSGVHSGAMPTDQER
ncbi:MAG TPA: winged helix-turn-helix domain-containing protein [Nakamurella sp.]|jgi:DNA-binding transcriptional ArsR family regulator|nr:winged helix-turn-helix domain-containing protein [Nakamurella sp.]